MSYYHINLGTFCEPYVCPSFQDRFYSWPISATTQLASTGDGRGGVKGEEHVRPIVQNAALLSALF
jgi:hypothetical protein